MSKLDTPIINDKLEEVFSKADSAAKIDIALGFALRNVKTGDYRYNYAHENNNLFEKLQLLSTKADLITVQGKDEKFDIVEQCTQQIQKTKWRFKLITDVTSLAALLKKIPMGCSDSVFPEPLLKNHSVNCLLSDKDEQPYKDHLCFFRKITKYLHSDSNLGAHKSQLFTKFVSKCVKMWIRSEKNFRGVSIDYLPPVEEIVERNIFIYNFDIQEGKYVAKSARQSIGKFEKTTILLRFFNHSIHTNDNDSVFNCFGCPSYNCFFNRSDTFNRHLLTCKDRVRHIRPENAYTLLVIKFETGFNIPYTFLQKI